MKRTRKKMRGIAFKLMSKAERDGMSRGDELFHTTPWQIRKATIQVRVEKKIKASQDRKLTRINNK